MAEHLQNLGLHEFLMVLIITVRSVALQCDYQGAVQQLGHSAALCHRAQHCWHNQRVPTEPTHMDCLRSARLM